MEIDPYEELENIDKHGVVEWALSESRKCVNSLRPLSDEIYRRALRYYTTPVVYNIKKNSAGVFYMKRDVSYTVNLVRKDRGETTIVDSRYLGEGAVIHNYYVDRDGIYLAYFYTLKGSDVGELVVVDLRNMGVVDKVVGSISDVVFLRGAIFYYSRFYRSGTCPDGVEAPCDRVFLREYGKDILVFGRSVPRNHFISLRVTPDGRKALVSISYGWSADTLYAGDLNNPGSWVKVFDGGSRSFFVDAVGDSYLVATYDGRGFGRIVLVSESEGVLELVPELGETLQDAMVVGGYVVTSYLRNASSILRVFELGGRFVEELSLSEPASVVGMRSYGDSGFIELRYFTKPYEILEVSPSGPNLELRKLMEHPRVVEALIEEGFAESYDKARIHYFWIRNPAGNKAVVVYGYGGFGIALTPTFYPWLPLFLELGFDVVIANLRGGSEYGEEWHRAGMRDRKINVFYDYIAIAEKFKAMGYRVAGAGRSNGGLLIGAVITMRPDLLDAAAIGYPVLDMLKFHKLYIGYAWVPEYGDPDNPSDREYLRKYSPYHNIKEDTRYPPTIIYTGLYDDRVHPAHALKFYAKLLNYGNPVCLRLETASGHAGSSPEVVAKEVADVAAFIVKHLRGSLANQHGSSDTVLLENTSTAT